MYTTYEFYTVKYHGDIIPMKSFNKFCDKACDEIDLYTSDRLVNSFPSDERAAARVQKAVCALADLLYRMEMEDKKAEDSTGYVETEDGTVIGKQITSISSGSESISYSTGQNNTSSLVGAVLKNATARKKLKYDTVKAYLSGVTDDSGCPLLYAGL